MKKCCILIAALLLLSGCAQAAAAQNKEIFAMNTVMTLSATGGKANEALTAAVAAINRADMLWNYKQEGSELYKLNHAGTQPVQCSVETIDVLQKALKYAHLTGGCFDPTIAPITQAWDITGNPRVPSDEEIAALLPLVDYTKLTVKDDMAGFSREGMMADLGGIGKGAVSDTVMGLFKSYGVDTALISLGGNIGVMGKKSDGKAYKIGIRDPDGTQNDTIGYVTMTDVFVI